MTEMETGEMEQSESYANPSVVNTEEPAAAAETVVEAVNEFRPYCEFQYTPIQVLISSQNLLQEVLDHPTSGNTAVASSCADGLANELESAVEFEVVELELGVVVVEA